MPELPICVILHSECMGAPVHAVRAGHLPAVAGLLPNLRVALPGERINR